MTITCAFCSNHADAWIVSSDTDTAPPTAICGECLEVVMADESTSGIITPIEEDLYL